MSTILCLTEIQNGQLKSINNEVFTAAKQLADEKGGSVTAVLIGNDVAGLAETAGKYGVSKVIVVDHDRVAKYSPDCYAAAAANVVRQENADIVLMGTTYMGKDLMARVAQILDVALAQDCISYRLDGDNIVFTRPMYAGKIRAEVRVTSTPVMATFRPKSFKPLENPTTPDVVQAAIDLPEPLAVVEEVESSASGKVDVTEADIIVSGGRGMKGPENWGVLEALAEAVGGVPGCSRPVSDDGWRPHDEHIGQTGKVVSPDLYIALGISGAIQHLAGISSSKFIVAVNKDPDAPIFKVADYGIVGDIFEVVPALTAEIKKVKAQD